MLDGSMHIWFMRCPEDRFSIPQYDGVTVTPSFVHSLPVYCDGGSLLGPS